MTYPRDLLDAKSEELLEAIAVLHIDRLRDFGDDQALAHGEAAGDTG